MKTYVGKLLILGIIIGLTAACSENTNEGYGTLKLNITDAPFPIELIDSANITITMVEVRLKSDSAGSEFVKVFEDTVMLNLMELRNGITANIAEVELPAGDIDLIRIYVDEASLTLKEGETYSVKVPSGSQTGIKVFIDPPLTIAGGLTSELLLDFSLEKSFVLKGNLNKPEKINGFNFKPVIRAVNNSTAGTVSGMAMDTSMLALPNVSVWISQDTTIASALTDSTGFYALPGLPEGTYILNAYKESFDTLTIENVVVKAANLTELDLEMLPAE